MDEVLCVLLAHSGGISGPQIIYGKASNLTLTPHATQQRKLDPHLLGPVQEDILVSSFLSE